MARRRRGPAVIALVLTWMTALYAQQRDATTTTRPAGDIATARISGIVVTDETPAWPVRRAIVTLTGGGLLLNRNAVTDDEGRFDFDGLPAGRFSLSAARASFITLPYGAGRPGRPGTPLSLSAGQQMTDVRLRLLRGAVVTGTVRDASGEPVPGLDVRLDRRDETGSASATVKTDDQGMYRIFGVPPGSYLVTARPASVGGGALAVPTDAEVDAALRDLQQRGRGGVGSSPAGLAPVGAVPGQGRAASAPPTSPMPLSRSYDFAPVFYPSALTVDDAVAVTVAAGEERRGIDMSLRLLATSTVAGRLPPIADRTITSVQVHLIPASAVGTPATRTASVAADGAFLFTGVPPGRYVLAARSLSAVLTRLLVGQATAEEGEREPTDACLVATIEVVASGDDVGGLSPMFRPCPRITGRIVPKPSASDAVPDLTTMRVALQQRSGGGLTRLRRVPPAVSADGRFRFGDMGEVLPGAYQLTVDVPSSVGRSWTVQSVMVDGRDVTDTSVEIMPTSPDATDVLVALSDSRSSLSGLLQTTAGRPAVDYTIVAFTTNTEWWMPPFRRVQTARPGTDGRFVFAHLPPGDYYVAALTDVEPGEATDPDFLALLVAASVRVVVREGQQTVQDLRMTGGW